MMYSLRQMDRDDKISQQVTMDVFAQIYPLATIEAVLEQQHAGKQKARRLRSLSVV
jgi:hypothetical protein